MIMNSETANVFPVMDIGDSLIGAILKKVPKEVALEVLADLDTVGFRALNDMIQRASTEMLIAEALQETGGDTRMLQHVRVQTVTLATVFGALLKNVDSFADGTHPLQQSPASETDGAL